jgi:hypothetical protein
MDTSGYNAAQALLELGMEAPQPQVSLSPLNPFNPVRLYSTAPCHSNAME